MQHFLCRLRWLMTIAMFLSGPFLLQAQTQKIKKEDRMNWWREARFGMFIHWGLYSIPAGEWNGQTRYGEWIRNNAQIPLNTYNNFQSQFNPEKFNADDWVRQAKEAGMKYIVITTKHHDGFCLFDSKYTDFDITNTPFKRDIIKEIADACHKQGMRLGFYYSIMDWHHPDYLPRRDWEYDRPTTDADFERYVQYMKDQLKELLTNYGKVSVLWFDGEWEENWSHERGKELYQYLRNIQPDIIINNRIDKGRSGMAGLTMEGDYAGDFGTPEQEIPTTGFLGVDWESCMTMNENWGYNSHDNNWKSSDLLLRNLIDIASKGGNLLLNVGPTAEGIFPPASSERLTAIGQWMQINGESIYGTSASPFKNIPWGRATQKQIPGGTKLYFQVFDPPVDGKPAVQGLGNKPVKVFALNGQQPLTVTRNKADQLTDISTVPAQPSPLVFVYELKGRPILYPEPSLQAEATVFTDQLIIKPSTNIPGAVVRYTINGTDPLAGSSTASPITIRKTTTIKAACFVNGKQVSAVTTGLFEKLTPIPAQQIEVSGGGLDFASYEGKWTKLPDFSAISPAATGTVANIDISMKRGKDEYAFVFQGYIRIPVDGVYSFYLSSDDGSKLFIDDSLAIDNDGMHGAIEKNKDVPLAKGYHAIKVMYFENSGGDQLELTWKGPRIPKGRIPDWLFFKK